MSLFHFASDLHGRPGRYEALFRAIRVERPRAVFLGGDLLPHPYAPLPDEAGDRGFLAGFVGPQLDALRADLGPAYPAIFAIPGNDDPAAMMDGFEALERSGLWVSLHGRRAEVDGRPVFGYACVPPTPFLLKDWERYDVSRFVDPGCVAPEDGRHSVDIDRRALRLTTIAAELDELVDDEDLSRAALLFHSPPHRTNLDRAALDGKTVDHAPVDVHVGSIAVRRFIEARQPLVTLHGHVHESTRLTGSWRDRFGRTHAFNGAHDGDELALVRFDPDDLDRAERELFPA